MHHACPTFSSSDAVLSFILRSISSIEDSLSASRSTGSSAPAAPAAAAAAAGDPARGCAAAARRERGDRRRARRGSSRTWDLAAALPGLAGFGGRMKSCGCSSTCLPHSPQTGREGKKLARGQVAHARTAAGCRRRACPRPSCTRRPRSARIAAGARLRRRRRPRRPRRPLRLRRPTSPGCPTAPGRWHTRSAAACRTR